jgi:hypothetical protein
MDAVTTPQVWVSTTTSEIDYDGQTPGKHWALVGEINASQESDFYTYIQVLLGLRQTARGPAEFYLDGYPDSEWVHTKAKEPFWVAIDPWGEMRPHIHGAHPTYYVSNAQATVTGLTRHVPESHPGRSTKGVKVPIKLKRGNGDVLTPWVQPGT